MKSKNILVLGYFGYQNNQLDGQTVKTRNIYELIKSRKNNSCNLAFFDTQDFQYQKVSVFRMIKELCRCDDLVYLPAQNNLTYIFPFVFILSLFKRYNILYVVIGGWLCEFLQNKPFHRYMLKRITAIFLENPIVGGALKENFGFNNIYTLSNFRIHDFVPSIQQKGKGLKIVFMSRIIMEKGIDVVFSLAEMILKNRMELPNINITFYGQIDEKDRAYFEKNIQKYIELVSYKGALSPDEINTVLSEYDLLILPTRYPTEGFPGAILDAYISGIPVMVSDCWKCSKEFVEDGITGFICDKHNEIDYYHKVEMLANNPKRLYGMKEAAYQKSKEYSLDSVWNKLKSFLNSSTR